MTNSTTDTIHDDPAAIEQDIRRTQDEMSRTVDRLGDQLTMKNLFNGLLDKADENGVDAQYLIDGARRNPMALGLIAAGAIWLVSDKDSKFPSVSSRGGKAKGLDDDINFDGRDIHHRDYVSHMSTLELGADEDSTAYQRRRDQHRANFLMCERKPDEDESGFRQRLDDLTEKFREKRHAWSDSVSQAGSSGSQSVQQAGQAAQRAASQAAGRVQGLYDSNPLIGGILAAAVGAALGSTVPISRKEQEALGDIGEDARNLVSEQKEQLTSKAMEKKDELLEKADEKLEASSGSQSGQTEQPGQSGMAAQPVGSASPAQGQDRPFIISETTR
jgi:hypothetical protein